ncbi:MAG: hypothetical protein NT093_05000 [Candidatus Moranbacteria bacterium]|nr:hypothetical protein [Candidatus Moranbacteria bacterium]
MNTTTDWIVAICAVISIPISIWAIMKANRAIKIVQNNTTKINEITTQGTGNTIGHIENANNNGVAGVLIETKNISPDNK